MENNLKVLLDKIYELEGLVHLAITRDDHTDDLLRLISLKGKDVGAICDHLESFVSSEFDPSKESIDILTLEEYEINDREEQENSDESEDSDDTGDDSRKKIKSRQRGKLVFTINERYRFKRDLFDNSDADFNNTLAVLASMENYDEAEEYFISEEGFNMGNPVVREFMEVIQKYFR